MKLFGKDLFGYRAPAEQMYDFAQHGLLNVNYYPGEYLSTTSQMVIAASNSMYSEPAPEKPKRKTPKELYDLKALNDNKFAIKVDSSYLAEQEGLINDKLSFLGKEPKRKRNRRADVFDSPYELGGVTFGRKELQSILMKLKNRRRLNEFKEVVDKYPHTTSELINKVITENNHLRCNRSEEFVPDFPRDAIKAMKEYDEMCESLCNKKGVYYVIADQEDFEKKNKRRDPILLAQSPFGQFWQILGAWDEEMVYLGEL